MSESESMPESASALEFISAAEAERHKLVWYKEEHDAVIDAINREIIKVAKKGKQKLVIWERLRRVNWHPWYSFEEPPSYYSRRDLKLESLLWVVPELQRKGFGAEVVFEKGGWFSEDSATLTITWGDKVAKKDR